MKAFVNGHLHLQSPPSAALPLRVRGWVQQLQVQVWNG
jgi:hypothetical protein